MLRPKAPKERRRGDLAVHTIAYGGSLLDVANLYQLHHHEIVALNPGVPKDRSLAVGAEVVVYRYEGEDSESVGLPHAGQLVGGMPMLDGPGRKITAQRYKSWATRASVLQLDDVLGAWAERYPDAPPVLVSNLSARYGGALSPHKTHQSGRDVDLGYPTRGDGKSDVDWQRVTPENLDAERTWAFLKLLVERSRVETIFIDRALQRALLRHALAHGTVRKNRLAHWLEVATGKRDGGPLIQHVPGHSDHMHVRFECPAREQRCRS